MKLFSIQRNPIQKFKEVGLYWANWVKMTSVRLSERVRTGLVSDLRYSGFCTDCLRPISMLPTGCMGSWETEILSISYLSSAEIFILSSSPHFLICSFVPCSLCEFPSVSVFLSIKLAKTESLMTTLWQRFFFYSIQTQEGERMKCHCLQANLGEFWKGKIIWHLLYLLLRRPGQHTVTNFSIFVNYKK